MDNLPIERLKTKVGTAVPGLGILLSILSAFAFSACVVTAKMLPNVNPMTILCARSVVQMSLCTSCMIYNGRPFSKAKSLKSKVFLALLGLSGGSTNFLIYAALKYLPPADVIGVLYCSPAFVSLLACLWLKESCTVPQGVTVVLAVAGAIFFSKPAFIFGEEAEDATSLWIGRLLALSSGVCYTGIFIFAKLLPQIPAATTNFLLGLVSLVLSIPFCMSSQVTLPACGVEGLVFMASALLGVLAYVLLTVAAKFEKATIVSVISSLEIVFTTPLQIVILGKHPQWNCYVGSVLIIASVLICGVIKIRSQAQISEKNITIDSKLLLNSALSTVHLKGTLPVSSNKDTTV